MVRSLVLFLALTLGVREVQGQTTLSQPTTDALVHVVAHEIGHAFLREFDLPILGPEEAIADDFATVYVYLTFPDRAGDIIMARAAQNLADDQDVGPFQEHQDDDQRAGRSVCLLYGLDPERYGEIPGRFGISERAASGCRGFGPEVGRSWRRLIDQYRMPEGARVTEVRLTGDDIPMADGILNGPLGEDIYTMMAAIDWHSLITFSVADCDGTAGWSRNGRRITLCSDYIARFEAQLGD